MTTPAADAPASAKGRQRRAELVAAGAACLTEEGWAGVTHRKVARRAGANPGLVHYHFGGLTGLREAIAAAVGAELIVPMARDLTAVRDTDELVAACLDMLTRGGRDVVDVGLLTQIMVGAHHYPEVRTVIREAIDTVERDVAEHLAAIGPGWTPTAARNAAALLLALFDGILLRAVAVGAPPADSDPDPDRLVSVLRCILAAPSRRVP